MNKKKYLDFADKQFKQIPEDQRPQVGDVFLCQTLEYLDPFQDWGYCVAEVVQGQGGAACYRHVLLGKFRNPVTARFFAEAWCSKEE